MRQPRFRAGPCRFARAVLSSLLGFLAIRHGELFAHTGSGIGYRSELRIHPTLGIGVAVLASAGHVATEPLAAALCRAAVGTAR